MKINVADVYCAIRCPQETCEKWDNRYYCPILRTFFQFLQKQREQREAIALVQMSLGI